MILLFMMLYWVVMVIILRLAMVDCVEHMPEATMCGRCTLEKMIPGRGFGLRIHNGSVNPRGT